MKPTSIGKKAEEAAAVYLSSKGYRVVERNFRTKHCEIDIIASRDDIFYFVEVKYRSQSAQGEGFDYITPSKLRQMEFACRIWSIHHDWDGDSRLAAVAVSGDNFDDIKMLEI